VPPPALHRHHHAVTIGAVARAVIGVAVFTPFAASMTIVVIAAGVGAYLGRYARRQDGARAKPST
jgi:hypothetical protein